MDDDKPVVTDAMIARRVLELADEGVEGDDDELWERAAAELRAQPSDGATKG